MNNINENFVYLDTTTDILYTLVKIKYDLNSKNATINHKLLKPHFANKMTIDENIPFDEKAFDELLDYNFFNEINFSLEKCFNTNSEYTHNTLSNPSYNNYILLSSDTYDKYSKVLSFITVVYNISQKTNFNELNNVSSIGTFWKKDSDASISFNYIYNVCKNTYDMIENGKDTPGVCKLTIGMLVNNDCNTNPFMLDVFNDNKIAINCYKRMGFVEIFGWEWDSNTRFKHPDTDKHYMIYNKYDMIYQEFDSNNNITKQIPFLSNQKYYYTLIAHGATMNTGEIGDYGAYKASMYDFPFNDINFYATEGTNLMSPITCNSSLHTILPNDLCYKRIKHINENDYSIDYQNKQILLTPMSFTTNDDDSDEFKKTLGLYYCNEHEKIYDWDWLNKQVIDFESLFKHISNHADSNKINKDNIVINLFACRAYCEPKVSVPQYQENTIIGSVNEIDYMMGGTSSNTIKSMNQTELMTWLETCNKPITGGDIQSNEDLSQNNNEEVPITETEPNTTPLPVQITTPPPISIEIPNEHNNQERTQLDFNDEPTSPEGPPPCQCIFDNINYDTNSLSDIESIDEIIQYQTINNINLNSIYIDNCYLYSCSFNDCFFNEITFHDTQLINISFKNCSISLNMFIESCKLQNVDFDNFSPIDSPIIQYKNSFLELCHFINNDLTSYKFIKTELFDCDFSGANLTNVIFEECDFTGVTFDSNTIISNTEFIRITNIDKSKIPIEILNTLQIPSLINNEDDVSEEDELSEVNTFIPDTDDESNNWIDDFDTENERYRPNSLNIEDLNTDYSLLYREPIDILKYTYQKFNKLSSIDLITRDEIDYCDYIKENPNNLLFLYAGQTCFIKKNLLEKYINTDIDQTKIVFQCKDVSIAFTQKNTNIISGPQLNMDIFGLLGVMIPLQELDYILQHDYQVYIIQTNHYSTPVPITSLKMRTVNGTDAGTAAVSANHCQDLVHIKSGYITYMENNSFFNECSNNKKQQKIDTRGGTQKSKLKKNKTRKKYKKSKV